MRCIVLTSFIIFALLTVPFASAAEPTAQAGGGESQNEWATWWRLSVLESIASAFHRVLEVAHADGATDGAGEGAPEPPEPTNDAGPLIVVEG